MKSWLASVCIILSLAVAYVTSSTKADISGLHVCGNQVCNGQGQRVRLIGVNRSGTEFACVNPGGGIFDGPTTDASIDTIKSWAPNTINIIRVPLNEDCWLGINGVLPAYGGENYIRAIVDWVNRLNNHGIAVILDLHWAAPGTEKATKQLPMPNKDHSVSFWTQVANTFKNNTATLFDIFNEPYPDNNNWNSQTGWTCWRDGGNCNGVAYDSAGMQTLVSAVRATVATNILTLGGLAYSNSLAMWLQYKPTDPTGNTIASWHVYNFNYCKEQGCWNQYALPVLKQVPVLVTEMGENDCQAGFVESLMTWLDHQNSTGYLAWTWNTWDCANGPALITSYSGTATNFGAGFKQYISRL